MNNSRFLRYLIVPMLWLVGCRIVPCAFATPPPGYYLVWNDEFNETALDTHKWDYWLLGPRRDAVNVTNAVSLTGSNLVITTCTVNGTNYTGMLASDQTFRARYGYWEASLKWGDTNGMWSAFWFQSPTMGAYLPDPVVSGSEIDDAEHRFVDGSGNNIANQVQVNIHWNGYGSAARSTGSGNVGSGLAASFHTYGFLWTPNAYTFLIDGATVDNGGSAPVSRSTEWPILSSEVDDTSTTWAGYIPSGGYGSLANSTTKLTVDYVRYYAPTNTLFWTGAGDATYLTNAANYIANLPPLPTSRVTFSYLSGRNLNLALGGNLSIRGLVFLNTKNRAAINGKDLLTIGAGGIDMVAADHPVDISCPVKIGTNQTWRVSSNRRGNTLNVHGNVSGTAGLTKDNDGCLILSGKDSGTGWIHVNAGSLLVEGTLRARRLKVIGGVLGGNGVIHSPVMVESGGALAPGDNAIGCLTISNSLVLQGTTFIKLNPASGQNDLLLGSSIVTYGGTLTVTNLAGDPGVGSRFKIFEAANYRGTFASFNLPALGPGLAWDTTALTNGMLTIIREQRFSPDYPRRSRMGT